MPTISRFLGIVVRMFWETGTSHHAPHLHVSYQGHKAVYRIDTVELIAGSLPKRQRRFIEAWIELYQDELMENWKLCEARELPKKIPPLRR